MMPGCDSHRFMTDACILGSQVAIVCGGQQTVLPVGIDMHIVGSQLRKNGLEPGLIDTNGTRFG
jgi:hypothetical protein